MGNSIFRKQSLDRVNSPEQLNDYIKTASPNVWLAVFGVLILVLSFFVWTFFASLDTTVTIDGVAKNNTVTCFTDDAGQIKINDKVKIGELTGTVLSVSEKPVSVSDAEAIAGADEYTLYCLELATWNYVIEISVDGILDDGYITAEVIVEQISPISFIFG